MWRSLFVHVIFLIGFLGCTTSQGNAPSAEEVLQKVAGLTNNTDLANFNTSGLPIEEVKNVFEQKCTKNGGPDAFKNALNAQQEMEQCIKSLVNMTELYAEMESAKPVGDLDVVFRKYCRKSPILKACVTNFTDAIDPCLDNQERESKRIVLNITDSLLGFICYKEGDRIALFIAAGGIECLQERQQDVQNCANATLGARLPTGDPTSGIIPSVDKLPSFVLGEKECRDMTSFQFCAVKALEKCTDPTPANIVDSILNFIRRVTPCESYADPLVSGTNINSAGLIFTALFTLITFL